MTRLFLLLLLLSSISFVSGQKLPIGGGEETENPFRSWEQNQSWEEVRELDGRFRILVPSAWEHRIDTIGTEVGELAYHTFWLQTPTDTADNVVYMLSYVDYPEGALHHDSTALTADFLDATEDEAASRLRGEVLFSTDKECNGYPGRFWRIDYLNGNASVRTQAFIAHNRYYALQTVSKSNLGVNRSTDKFFDSFAIF